MKIILRENVENLGRMGEEYTVKTGYASNFLIPQGMAFPATTAYKNIVTSELKHKKALYEKDKQKAIKLLQDVVHSEHKNRKNRLFSSTIYSENGMEVPKQCQKDHFGSQNKDHEII